MPEGSILPFVLVVVLFFIWGMSNNLTDILVQQFRKGFNLSQLQAQMVQSAVFFGYFCMALPAALLMRRWGYKAGIIAGLCTFGVGTLLFWPAAIIGQYGPFLLALYVVGCGSAMLETAANPLVAQMGAPETSERRLNLAQAFNPPGTITGVLVGTYFIFSGVELAPQKVAQMKAAGTYAGYLHGEIMRVVPTYVVLGSAVLLWALVIGLTRFPAIAGGASPLTGESVGSFRELKTYYFHNCIYGKVYETDSFRDGLSIHDLLLHCTREWKLVVVGDASMHPSELLGGGGWYGSSDDGDRMAGVRWMQLLADHFDRSAWLNPDTPTYWKGGTAEMLASLYPMYHLTLEGLGEAMAHLSKGPARKR